MYNMQETTAKKNLSMEKPAGIRIVNMNII